ncbi:MAG: protein kinase [Planctomycetales bacterium]|nr:protein kinase [Planctomycetales bacterium]
MALACLACERELPATDAAVVRCACGAAWPRVTLEQEAAWARLFALPSGARLPIGSVRLADEPGRLTGRDVGGYRLGRLLGRGGMGEVYAASRQGPSVGAGHGADYAVKVLPRLFGAGADLAKRFAREARLARELRHPNLVPVLDAGEAEECVYLVMPYVEGVSLQALVDSAGPLAPEVAGRMIGQAAQGLHAAHMNCVVHRDVKPGNVLVTPAGRVRVADFGLAKRTLASSHLTVTGQIVGTPAFMSPEQCDGRPVDARSDVYSLGATFFFLLTGGRPFEAETPFTIMYKHLHDPPPRPSSLRLGVPPALDDVVLAMLTKDPERRYQSCEAVLWDLAQVLGGSEPALSRAPSRAAEFTRALERPGVSDAVVERALDRRRALLERGEYAPPLGELLEREAGPGYGARGSRAAAAGAPPAARCPRCGRDGPVPPAPAVCGACGGPLVLEGELALEDRPRVALLRSDRARLEHEGPEHGPRALRAVRACLASGRPHVVLHYPRLRRFANENFLWVMDAFEEAAAAGGSLGFLVPDEKVRHDFAAVGVDQYVRVFASEGEVAAAAAVVVAAAAGSPAPATDTATLPGILAVPAVFRRARRLALSRSPRKALEYLESVRRSGAGGADAESLARVEERIGDLVARRYVIHAARCADEGNARDGYRALHHALAIRPGDPAALLQRARLLSREGRHAEADAQLTASLEKVPGFAPALHERGKTRYFAGLAERAAEDFRAALALEPRGWRAAYNLACLAALAGRRDEAFDWLARAVGAGLRDADLLAQDPHLASLRADPRWAPIEREAES